MHWDLLEAMEEAFDQNAVEFQLTPVFWVLTRRTHQGGPLLRLARFLYDPHQIATSLGNLLQTLKAHASDIGTIFPGSNHVFAGG